MSHRVAVPALDGVLPLDLGIPAWVFNEARKLGQAQFIEHPVPQDTDRSTSVTCQWAGPAG
ncbi:hypothetical protein [Streptomyces brasiliensis]|uniref:Uncharacterized protein n=1 Tax=Streptomyces brasiliensis TaxID=1954 RepID=A0A917KYX9_9ACTN|nr:hypothetical protein [Streptomyces brasiliensis]GGJ33477.1 hypothetical protein GCM10010121_050800 [Streptomyces brasiliensis]